MTHTLAYAKNKDRDYRTKASREEAGRAAVYRPIRPEHQSLPSQKPFLVAKCFALVVQWRKKERRIPMAIVILRQLI